jgi:hypothetical protein
MLVTFAWGSVAVQALQLAMLRRLAKQLLGVSSAPLLPELLLTDALDAAGSGSPGSHADASHKCMRMLQELQAMAASSWPLQLSVGEIVEGKGRAQAYVIGVQEQL